MSLIISAPKKKEKEPACKYAWTKDEKGVMRLVFDDNIMSIWEDHGRWVMTAFLDGHGYRGERETLEAAAKAADRLLYEKFKNVWTQTDAHVIIDPWKGDLPL